MSAIPVSDAHGQFTWFSCRIPHVRGRVRHVVPSFCVIRKSLGVQFATAARLYAEAATSLALDHSEIEYALLLDQTVQAQDLTETAFRAFKEHVASHECGAPIPRLLPGREPARRLRSEQQRAS